MKLKTFFSFVKIFSVIFQQKFKKIWKICKKKFTRQKMIKTYIKKVSVEIDVHFCVKLNWSQKYRVSFKKRWDKKRFVKTWVDLTKFDATWKSSSIFQICCIKFNRDGHLFHYLAWPKKTDLWILSLFIFIIKEGFPKVVFKSRKNNLKIYLTH